MPQAGRAQLATVNCDGRFVGASRDLGGDCKHAVEPVVAGDVQVAHDLLVLEPNGASLDLDEARPSLLASPTDDRSVRDHRFARAVLEAHLRERLDGRRLWGTKLFQEGVAELWNAVHDRKEAGG